MGCLPVCLEAELGHINASRDTLVLWCFHFFERTKFRQKKKKLCSFCFHIVLGPKTGLILVNLSFFSQTLHLDLFFISRTGKIEFALIYLMQTVYNVFVCVCVCVCVCV